MLSTYLANRLLNHVLRNTAYTPPSTVYLALHTEDPTDAGTGDEVSGGSYARQVSSWVAASAKASPVASPITFTNLPAADITHVSVWDASSGGNMLFYGALDQVYSASAGESLTFASSSLTNTLV